MPITQQPNRKMNPLTVRLQVLEKVFNHLTLEELKTCRLVNKAWSQEATIQLRHSVASIPIGTVKMLKDLTSIADSSPSIPFTKINFSSHFFSMNNCEPAFHHFLSTFSPDLESLTLTLDKESESLKTLLALNFPKLFTLSIIGHRLDSAPCSRNGTMIPQVLQHILSSSPKIESLSLTMDNESKETVKHVIYFISTIPQNFKGLQTLEIYCLVGDKEILLLSKMQSFHLKYLKCDFHRSCFLQESLKDFLSAQSGSLEYLKFDNYYGNSCYTVSFPVMPKVKSLKIDGRSELSSKEVRFLPFSYTRQFSSLQKLVLGGSIELNTCWKILLSPEDTVVTSLKHLKLTARFIDAIWVQRIGTIFPHIEKLYYVLTPQNEKLARVVFKAFPNVRHLVVYLDRSMGNVDHLFAGLEEQVCDKLSLAQQSFGGLTNLKYLETLCFKADKSNASHISDVTVKYSLMKMKSLKKLQMPVFQISPQCLIDLQEKVELILTQ